MSNYANQVRSIKKRYPLDLQKRKLAGLLNTVIRESSRISRLSYMESQNLSRDITMIRRAMSEVSKQLECQR